MTIDKPFNQFSKQEYLECIPNHQLYTEFNTLGLYRSLLENGNLSKDDKLEIRELSHYYFKKTFDFLQLKDPQTFFEVSTIGVELTKGDELNWWRIIRENQEKIIKEKKLNHRNFGSYAKHDCGIDYCPYNGLMIRQGSPLAETSMHFKKDRNKDVKMQKALRIKKESRDWKRRRYEEED